MKVLKHNKSIGEFYHFILVIIHSVTLRCWSQHIHFVIIHSVTLRCWSQHIHFHIQWHIHTGYRCHATCRNQCYVYFWRSYWYYWKAYLIYILYYNLFQAAKLYQHYDPRFWSKYERGAGSKKSEKISKFHTQLWPLIHTRAQISLF